MGYLALYRKYRPTDMSNFVGQQEIKEILSNSVIKNKISHAYLFSGPRGTGKTSMAKLFAKMVNCINPVDGNPCGECNSCLNIMNSSDVVEIDAASNNGVDEIRDLREKATLVPSSSKYKVYIIDEVHMLTIAAFNALLKILEEPPKHVIFILATTEYHKIPLTILSRCQKYQFNKIDTNSIVDRLKYISGEEKILIDDDALYEIAKVSDGGLRDSINFLDQLSSFSNSRITIDDVYDICGNVSKMDLTDLFVNLKEKNITFIVNFFEKMSSNGKNFSKLIDDMYLLLNDVILLNNGVDNSLIKSNIDCVEKLSYLYGNDDIFKIIKMLNSIVDKLKSVSRQSVFLISNFLILMNEIDDSLVDKFDKSECLKKDNNSFNKVDIKLSNSSLNSQEDTSVNLHNNVKNDLSACHDYMSYKETIINNTFAIANKEIKNDLQTALKNINNYLTDKNFSTIAGYFIDTKIVAAGNYYIIFTGNYDSIILKIYENYKLCLEFLKVIFGNYFKFAVISDLEWNKYKSKYIENINNGVKYNLINIDDDVFFDKVHSPSTDAISKLISIVGEDVIEFK